MMLLLIKECWNKIFSNCMGILSRLIGKKLIMSSRIPRKVCFIINKNVKGGVLICTDVASRGLDFHDVMNTILFDMPDSVTEYAHRIGRTARISKTGKSLLILMQKVLHSTIIYILFNFLLFKY